MKQPLGLLTQEVVRGGQSEVLLALALLQFNARET